MHSSNKRLANVKTREESGLNYVLGQLNIKSPYGNIALKNNRIFFPGMEAELREIFQIQEKIIDFIRLAEKEKAALDGLYEEFYELKDCTQSISRAGGNILTETELFDLKGLFIAMSHIYSKVSMLINQLDLHKLPEPCMPLECEHLVDILDPNGERMPSFYIYDTYSEKLKQLRADKKSLDKEVRSNLKEIRRELEKNEGISLTPKFDIVIPKSSALLDKARSCELLVQNHEDYVSVGFAMKEPEHISQMRGRAEEIATLIEEEELSVREQLSQSIAGEEKFILDALGRLGQLDFYLAKGEYFIKHNCKKPEIVSEHMISFKDARHPRVEALLAAKGKEYCPISIELEDGVACITGANMGGKTISLKLISLMMLMTQYGLYLPCEWAKVGLSSSVSMLVGDSQSIERGLSSFGSEMEELKLILQLSQDRAMILIDEIASGTNPIEGLALTKGLISYLMKRQYISVITTHFEVDFAEHNITSLQVRGLSGVDFNKLDKEIRYAKPSERIDIIGKYMDYSLCKVEDDKQVPKDALNIAKILGIDEEIIQCARTYINVNKERADEKQIKS